MHRLRGHRPTPALLISIVALAVALGGVASASIPGAKGTIHACYKEKGGALRVIDAAGSDKCQPDEKSLNWTSDEVVRHLEAALQQQQQRLGHDTGRAFAGTGTACTMGEMILTAGRTANGIPARGQILPISAHHALFSLLGTTYGGDGIKTFALPDLRSVTPNDMTYSICDEGHYPSHR